MKSPLLSIKRRIKQYRCRVISASQRKSINVTPGELNVTTFYDVEGDYAIMDKSKPCFEALNKILKIEEECGIHSTYNVVAKFAMEAPELFREIESAGHEIASHSLDHKVLTGLSDGEKRDNVFRARDLFSKIGINVIGHRSPQSQWDFSLVQDLKEAGYLWNAENDAMNRPYIISNDKKTDKRLWRIPVSMDDWKYEGEGLSTDEVLKYWKDRVIAAQKIGGYMSIGFHPWVEAPGDRIEAFESFFHWLSEREGIKTMSFKQLMQDVNTNQRN